MNKKLLVSFALASLTGISTQAKEKMSSETTQQRPNIILFMVDDMGWQDTSLPFWTQKTHYNEAYETPNMERLAKKGTEQRKQTSGKRIKSRTSTRTGTVESGTSCNTTTLSTLIVCVPVCIKPNCSTILYRT